MKPPKKNNRCKHCNDTGVIETGNNDLPCRCKAGDEAIFNTSEYGTVYGIFLKRKWRRGIANHD